MTIFWGDTRYWRRQYNTRRKVVGSSLDKVIGFFQFTESFQPHYGAGVDLASLTEMSTRNISGG
jgi:hypothetical protein